MRYPTCQQLGWAVLKSAAQNSIKVSHTAALLEPSSHPLLQVSNKQKAGIQNGTRNNNPYLLRGNLYLSYFSSPPTPETYKSPVLYSLGDHFLHAVALLCGTRATEASTLYRAEWSSTVFYQGTVGQTLSLSLS